MDGGRDLVEIMGLVPCGRKLGENLVVQFDATTSEKVLLVVTLRLGGGVHVELVRMGRYCCVLMDHRQIV